MVVPVLVRAPTSLILVHMAGETTLDQVIDGSMAHIDSLQQRLVIIVVDLLVIFYKEVPQRKKPTFEVPA